MDVIADPFVEDMLEQAEIHAEPVEDGSRLYLQDEQLMRSGSRRSISGKSPQFFYLTLSLVVALLALIIAEEPFGPSTTLSPSPKSMIQQPPPWHDWVSIIRKIPKNYQQNGNTRQKKRQYLVVQKNSNVSSRHYCSATVVFLRSCISRVMTFLVRYIDPILIGERAVGTAAMLTTTAQEDEAEQRQPASNDIQYYSPSTIVTALMDKVITSKPRLVIFVNLILSITFVTHASIANYFLHDERASPFISSVAEATGDNIGIFPSADFYSNNAFDGQTFAEGGRQSPFYHQPNDTTPTYALRFVGGYLLFKLLLISSVLSPLHTLDVLILLIWFTVLCFQRSLAYMAHMNLNRLVTQQMSVTHHYRNPQRQSPGKAVSGVLVLLLIVLSLTIFSGFGWVMFFYKAGIPMVLLLLMDSAILILDVIRYIFIYVQGIVLEGSYQLQMNELEENQIKHILETIDADARYLGDDRQLGSSQIQQEEYTDGQIERNNRESFRSHKRVSSAELKIQRLELQHSYYSSILQSAIFSLELASSTVTGFHFLHIWYLHGLSFGLVDAILLLHLHSSVSSVIRKVAERHQIFRLSRSLNSIFQDASEIELRKAHACGDLCCICLGAMLGANVKKLKCGHLYHSHCLRKVVERVKSITAARCPLCRSPLVGQLREGRVLRAFESDRQFRENRENNESSDANEAASAPATVNPTRPHNLANENALFRFTTDGLLPHWLPLPAFSFEIVRRQPNSLIRQDENTLHNTTSGTDRVETDPSTASEFEDMLHENQGPFLRRLLGIIFAPQMSPEEESGALAQLVEMFPQYERDDLRRELQSRSSIENVAESILLGAFSGLPRTED